MKQMINKWLELLRCSQTRKRVKRLRKHASQVIQAREYNGKLYVAYYDVPLVSEDELAQPLTEALLMMRSTYVTHKMSEYE